MLILEEFLASLRTGDLSRLEARLAPELVWKGLRPDLVCNSRDEALEVIRHQLAGERHITALELVDAGDKVVFGVRAPEITEVAGERLDGAIFQVFTFRDDRIVEMQDFRSRSEALAAAGVTDD